MKFDAKTIIAFVLVIATAIVSNNVEALKEVIRSSDVVSTIVQGLYGLLALVVTVNLKKE